MSTTTKRIAGIAAGAALLLVVVWYFALFSPESHHLTSARAARAAAAQQVSSLDAQVAQLEVVQKQIPADRVKLASRTAAVPNNPQLPDALAQFHADAVLSGVTLSSLSPTEPTAGSSGSATAGTPSIDVSISTTGSYQQLQSFMTLVSRMPRTVVLNTMSISAGASTTLTANFTAEIFYAGSPTP
jgi:Tfp pilus assembly protein PilO